MMYTCGHLCGKLRAMQSISVLSLTSAHGIGGVVEGEKNATSALSLLITTSSLLLSSICMCKVQPIDQSIDQWIYQLIASVWTLRSYAMPAKQLYRQSNAMHAQATGCTLWHHYHGMR